jgi:hypothetical protein
MDVMLLGKKFAAIVVIPMFSNAEVGIDVNEEERTMVVNARQFLQRAVPIDVTELGKVKLASCWQPLKAKSPMLSKPFVKLIVAIDDPRKLSLPIEVTVEGMVTPVKVALF